MSTEYFYHYKSSDFQPGLFVAVMFLKAFLGVSVLNVDRCLTGRGLGDVHVRCLQRHRGVELEWDVICQRYSQNSHFVSLLHFTLLTLSLQRYTSMLHKSHTLCRRSSKERSL